MSVDSGYPRDRQARYDLRRELHRREMDAAEQRAQQACRSWLCARLDNPQHAGEDGGCADDGRGCLCPCHETWTCISCAAVTDPGSTVCRSCADIP